MIPLKDRNPTQRFAWVTILLLVVNIGVFVFIQGAHTGVETVDTPLGQLAGPADDLFSLEFAAIPCELVTGEPLSLDEVRRTFNFGETSACDRDRDNDEGEQLFPDKQVWASVVFSMFLHGGLLHLGGNMLFLWVFGNNIEDKLGHIWYAVFYLIGGVVAAGAHVLVDPSSTIPVVGASGAVAGVMGAYLVWFPRAPILTAFIMFFIFIREIPAVWLLGFWFVLQFFTGPGSGVAWAAHVGGFVFGAAIAWFLRSRVRARQAYEWRVLGPHDDRY